MIKVLVVSDTHGRNERWLEIKKKVNPDIVLHAGDHCTSKEFMNEHATYWVAGNNDYIGDEIQIFTINDIRFILLHGHQVNRTNREKWRASLAYMALSSNASVLVYGHSHIEDVESVGKILTINPGSLEFPRNNQMLPTYITFEVHDNEIKNIETHYYTFN